MDSKEKLVPEATTITHGKRRVKEVVVTAVVLLVALLCVIGATFMAGWAVGRFTHSSATSDESEESSATSDDSTLGYPENPASSCKQVSEQRPNAPSGKYWIKPDDSSSSQLLFCNMEHVACSRTGDWPTRGWMQVVNLIFDDTTTECPRPFELLTPPVYNYSCGTTGIRSSRCISTSFSVHGVEYTQVTGRVYAYQQGLSESLSTTYHQTINGPYIDGVSITTVPPRRHIWSFQAATDGLLITDEGRAIFGDSFFCEGDEQYIYYNAEYFEHLEFNYGTGDTLWDGEGCGGLECCTRAPWFCQKFSEPSTSDIEVRICGDGYPGGSIGIHLLELYVQ